MGWKPILARALWAATIAAVLPVSSAAAQGSAASGAAPAELSARHKEWLQQVTYIIEKQERRLFESLPADWQRDRFIEAFWARRDPQPVTPENEYRIEYMRRWKYVNEVFGRDTPVPGWRTERGRVYLVNGPPYQIHPYPNTQELWPLELWEYRDAPRPGMPSFYQILFYKPRVFNEWRLYSPAVDGPEALLIASPADLDNINVAAVATKFPMVFSAAQQAAPGLGALGSEALIARTMAPPPPPRPLSLYYSAAGDVETSFVDAAPLALRLQATGFAHPELEGYVDVTVEIPAAETRFVAVEDELVANYRVDLEIRTADAGTWRQEGAGVVVRVPSQEGDLVETLPVQFHERLWLLPGRYDIRALVTETASRRVGAVETTAIVPAREGVLVSPPELFYVMRPEAGTSAPSPGAPVPWPDERLRLGHPVGCRVRVLGAVAEGRPAGAFPEGLELEYSVARAGDVVWRDTWSGQPAARLDADGWTVLRQLQLQDLPAGAYELRVRARLAADGERPAIDLGTIGRRRIELVDEFLPLARLLPAEERETGMAEAHHALGRQALRRNDFAAAREHFERAVRLDPKNPGYKVDAAKTLVLSGELAVADFLLSEALHRDPDNQEGYATLGLLRLQQGDSRAAIEAYRRALDLAPGTPAIYNGLAEAYLSVGETDSAIEMLDLSLGINAEQQQVRELRARLAQDMREPAEQSDR